MKVIRESGGEHGDCLMSYIDFESTVLGFSEDITLFWGYQTPFNKELISKHKDDKHKILYQHEHPSGLHSPDHQGNLVHMNLGEPFDVVYSNCPYTVDWLNETHFKSEKYKVGSFVLNEKYVPTEGFEKNKEVCYWGNTFIEKTNVVKDIVESISEFDYHYFTMLTDGNIHFARKYATGVNLPRKNLWEAIRTCKIMVIQNLLYLSQPEIEGVKRLPDYIKNEAFQHLHTDTIPQIKTRGFEAAFNKTLMLVKRDPWNVIEHWFEPEVDFVYYDSESQLKSKIRDILENWVDYKQIVENAYDKAVSNYTTKNLIKKIVKENY
jgi:hypothetical protein|tara:strand:- start:2027 stop:2992 length:966 start_codon:yes stop_codon:yes gene_type:complete